MEYPNDAPHGEGTDRLVRMVGGPLDDRVIRVSATAVQIVVGDPAEALYRIERATGGGWVGVL